LLGARGLEAYATSHVAALGADEANLAALRARDVQLTRVIEESRARLQALRAGDTGDPRAHLRHAAVGPAPDIRLLVVVIWFRIMPPLVAIPVVLGGYLAIEAFFDRSIGTLLLRIAVVLAIVSAIILAVTFIRELVLLALLGLGLLLITDNLGELRRRSE